MSEKEVKKVKEKAKTFAFSENPDAQILKEARQRMPKTPLKVGEKRYAYACQLCGWGWFSRFFAADIRCCPHCKSTKWNRRDICPTCGAVKRKERKKDAKK